MADIRCITKTGKERWLPEKLARDKKFLAQMELTVQDLEEDKKKVEAIIKPEPKITTEDIIENCKSDSETVIKIIQSMEIDNSGIEEITPVVEPVKTEVPKKVKTEKK